MRIPIRLALKTATRENQHVAFAFKGGAFLNYAINRKGTLNGHAEVRVLSGVTLMDIHEPRNITIVSLRVNKRGMLAMAKPCKTCHRILSDYGVKKVFYSNRSGQIERL